MAAKSNKMLYGILAVVGVVGIAFFMLRKKKPAAGGTDEKKEAMSETGEVAPMDLGMGGGGGGGMMGGGAMPVDTAQTGTETMPASTSGGSGMGTQTNVGVGMPTGGYVVVNPPASNPPANQTNLVFNPPPAAAPPKVGTQRRVDQTKFKRATVINLGGRKMAADGESFTG